MSNSYRAAKSRSDELTSGKVLPAMNCRGRGLVWCPNCARSRTHRLHLVEIVRVRLGCQRRRGTRPELARRIEQQRAQLRQPRVEERRKRGRGRSPDPRRWRVIERDRRESAVVLAQPDEPPRRVLAVLDPLPLRPPVGNLGERRGQRGVQPTPRGGEVLEQDVVRGHGSGGLGRRLTRPAIGPVVELVAPGDADNRVVDGRLLKREPHETLCVRLASVNNDRVEGDRVPIADDLRIGCRFGRGCRRLNAADAHRQKCDGYKGGHPATSAIDDPALRSVREL